MPVVQDLAAELGYDALHASCDLRKLFTKDSLPVEAFKQALFSQYGHAVRRALPYIDLDLARRRARENSRHKVAAPHWGLVYLDLQIETSIEGLDNLGR